jgi:hypothetical protein
MPRGAALPRPARVTVSFGPALHFDRTPAAGRDAGRGKQHYQEISDAIMAAIGRLKTEREQAAAGARARGATTADPTTRGRAAAGRIH